jgi:hypothetical protein
MKSSLLSQLGSGGLVPWVAHVALILVGLVISETVLAQECPLTTPLMIKDTQDGFAGQTGTVWTILPDCSFTVARQIGTKITDPIRQGHLTPRQETLLKEQLARTPLAEMPAQLGNGPQVNARRITLSYGARVSVLVLPAGGGELSTLRAAAGDDLARRLLELADSVNGMTGT